MTDTRLASRWAEPHGYAMAALLVGMAVMAVFMGMALPVWSTAAQRAREDELVFRGEQYARAIGLYQRKYANALPPSIDVLVNERFLRKKYLDPVTGGEFQPLTGATAQAAPGPGAGRGGASGVGSAPQGAVTQGRGPTSGPVAGRGGFQAPAFGAAGGIVGVASKSTEKALRMYNGRSNYNEWTFIAVQRQQQAGGGVGSDAPGLGGRGAAGRGGRAGQPPVGTGPRSNRPPASDGGFRPQSPFGGGSGGFRPGGSQGR